MYVSTLVHQTKMTENTVVETNKSYENQFMCVTTCTASVYAREKNTTGFKGPLTQGAWP